MTSVACTPVFGAVSVFTTNGRGATPEELAERAINRVIYVSDTAPPVIKAQAEAYKYAIHAVLLFYMHEAVKAHNTTIINKLTAAGHPELSALLSE